MAIDKLQVLRTIDKFDRLGDLGVFDLLTSGRVDASGSFTPGCGLSSAQAVALIGYINSGRDTPIGRRLALMCRLEETVVDPGSGQTAWDRLLAMPITDDDSWRGGRPNNIGWALDDIIAAQAQTAA